jgi:fatty acid elongase 3
MTMNYEYSFTFQKWKVGSAFEVASPYTYVIGFGSVLAYLLLIFVVFPAMKPRGTQELTAMRSKAKIHYVLLCVYSGICSFSTLYHIYTTGEIYSLESYLCEPCPYWMRMLSLSFIFSKIWEWFDTAVLIWNESTLLFLHCYHHATTFLLFLIVENFHGTSKSGMLLNGFVHFLMYYHYAFRLPRFMRPLITIAQIIQLAVVTYFWYVSPATCPAYADFPVSYPLEFNIPYGLVPVYLCFFLKFFFESYVMSPKKKST